MSLRLAGKRVLFVAVTLALIYGAVELGAVVLHRVSLDTWPSLSDMARRRQAVASAGVDSADLLKQTAPAHSGLIASRVLHPYVGYLYEPGGASLSLVDDQRLHTPACRVNAHGFFGTGDFLYG